MSINSKPVPGKAHATDPRLKKLTLNDIARQAGVSRATVSNAFNHPELLAGPMRERILGLARELGYFGPDPMARAMRRKDMEEVAVVFHHDLSYALNDPLSIDFLRGVATELDKRQLSLQLIPKMGRRVNLHAAFQTTADALIVHAVVTQELVPELRAVRKPLAMVDTFVSGLPCVSIDDRQGAYLAMKHALLAQPEAVVVLCLPVGEVDRAHIFEQPDAYQSDVVGGVRMAGYLQALRGAGYPLNQVTWLEIDDTQPEAAADISLSVLGPLLQSKRVALLAMSDRMALSTLMALQKNAWNAPVATVGFDDIPEAAQAGLTTIRQNAKLKGELAVRIALDGLASVRLPVELIVRST